MDSEELKRRTKEFAHRCVKLAVSLPETALGRHIKGQLIRSSTSVAANYRASSLSQTKAVFISKQPEKPRRETLNKHRLQLFSFQSSINNRQSPIINPYGRNQRYKIDEK